MSHPTQKQFPESLQFPALDAIVKYSLVLTWLTYFAGLARMAGFLHNLGVPTESSFFALPTVFSYGSSIVLEILLPTSGALILMAAFEKKTPRVARYVGWSIPAVWLLGQNLSTWKAVDLSLGLTCALFLLGASYLIIKIVRKKNPPDEPLSHQLIWTLVGYLLVTGAAGYTGDIEGQVQRTASPSIRLLLAPDIVESASKLGLKFSTPSEPALSDPVNVVVVSEKMYYVWIPVANLTADAKEGAVQLQWGHGSLAIPRDKVLLGRASLQ